MAGDAPETPLGEPRHAEPADLDDEPPLVINRQSRRPAPRRPPTPAEAPPPPTLVDESLNHRLAGALVTALGAGADVSSCRSRAWLGRLNGALIEDMAVTGLRLLVTADTLLWSQHRARIEGLGLSVVLVRDPRSVMGRAAAIAVAVRAVAPGAQHEVPAP